MLPIAERELRTAARQPRTYRSRLLIGGISVLLFAWMIWMSGGRRGFSGPEMFSFFSWLAYVYCVFTGVAATADSVSSEKREQTLGLLFLTPLKGYDIVLGKLMASSLNCFFGLLAMFPVLAIPLLMGGVQLVEFGRVALNLINTLVLSISVGLFVSSLSRHPLRATGLALLAMIFFGFGLAGLAEVVRGYYKAPAVASWLDLFSPLSCQTKAFSRAWGLRFNDYWSSLLALHLTALSLLALSSWIVPRNWQEKPGGRRAFAWRERLRQWKFGSPRHRQAFRTRLLRVNPFYWLASRERISSLEFLLLLVGFVSVASWAAWRVGQEFGGPIQPLLGFLFAWFWAVLLLHALLLFRMAVGATHRLAEDRHSGALELIAATPLDVRRIVRGQWLALARQMAAPILIVLLAQAFLLRGVVDAFLLETGGRWGLSQPADLFRAWSSGGLDREAAQGLTFVGAIILAVTALIALHWVALGWVGMWMGLRVKRPRTAAWATLALVLIPPWPVYGLVLYGLDRISYFWSEFEYLYLCLKVGFGFGCLHTVILSFWAWRKLRRQFRVAVTDRFLFLNQRRSWPERARLAMKFAAVFGAIVALGALWHGVENWRGQRAWNRFQRELQARGEILDVESIAPPAIPPEQNFAAAPVWAPLFGSAEGGGPGRPNRDGQRLNTLHSVNLEGQPKSWRNPGGPGSGNWRAQSFADLGELRKHFQARSGFRGFPKAPETASAAEAVLFALSRFDVELEAFRTAAQRPLARFPLKSTDPQNRGLFPAYLAILGNVGEVLNLRASARLAHGLPNEARADLELICRLAEALRQDVSFQSQQIRRELIGFAIQTGWEGLASHQWTDRDLAALAGRFQGFTPLAEYPREVRTEIVERMQDWEGFRSVLERDRFATEDPERGRWILRPFYPSGWTYYREIGVYRFYQNHLTTVIDADQHRAFMKEIRRLENALAKSDDFLNSRYNRSARWFGGFVLESARLQVAVDQLRLACALERWRLAHGSYPESLAPLAPELIAAIPHDVVTGDPLQYRRTDDGSFVLYSVGTNEKDDGGNRHNELDWVWKYRAR